MRLPATVPFTYISISVSPQFGYTRIREALQYTTPTKPGQNMKKIFINKISQNLCIQFYTHKKKSFGISMKPGAVVCTSLSDFHLNVTGSCIIERESLLTLRCYLLLVRCRPLWTRVQITKLHFVNNWMFQHFTFIIIMIMYMNPYHLLLIKT